MTFRRIPVWRGPPLVLQIMALLLGVLVVAQLATLVLTMLLPPAPQAQYGLDDVAAMLAAGDAPAAGAHALVRTVQAGPPDISGPGWLDAEKSRVDLARLVGATSDRVVLAFYTPLPFAGTATQRAFAMADDGFVAPFAGDRTSLRPIALLMQGPPPQGAAGTIGGGMRPPREGFPSGFPPDSSGSGRMREPGEAVRPGARRSVPQDTPSRREPQIGVESVGAARSERLPGAAGPISARVDERSPQAVPPSAASATNAQTPQTARRAGEGTLSTPATAREPLATSPRVGPPLFQGLGPPPVPRVASADRAISAAPPSARVAPPLLEAPEQRAIPPLAPQTRAAPRATPSPPVLALPLLESAGAAASAPAPIEAPAGPPIRIAPRRSLFGFAPAPFVEGDFIAAMRLADGRWAVVQPAPEPFPNSWQRRVLLWFAVSLALVAPFGWLFARRLVKPLHGFASAAEALGRDPAAIIGPLDGPAEIGRAAHAFNLMQTRLRTFVDDRTAMIGAISHDLRTPLTRMRFRIEDAPDDMREGLLEEVDDMEAMINEVIDFLRDASTPCARERCDLELLVEDVVEQARMVGSDVTIERSVTAPVEVDVLGMRRLLDNLLENAVKYGSRARIRLSTDADSAIAEVIDEGPGLPEDEIDRVFEPFYRSEAARASQKAGTGLGLAVCRSIARAHGGDVHLVNSHEGFRARMRVPLAYGAA